MTTTGANATNVIQIIVYVPVNIPDDQRSTFEQKVGDFLFGSDRVRPELREALEAEGVDFNHLALLSQQPAIGLCPSPGALEFVPSERVAEVCQRHGIDLTSGGSVQVGFKYDVYDGDRNPPSDALEIMLKLPRIVHQEASDSAELVADIVRALFGDCQLAAPAQAYLRAHGINLTEIAARNVDRLGGADVPFTSRVSPEVHSYLSERGFNLDQMGRFDVNAVAVVNAGVTWTKATCC
ncbi:hypothetical protein [Streptacidiphilus anmyonensis]|uniref:hypothetical protein n=1 Tax=Streptacidiphilus anmyonensis TaxID=405782 RepID=UPI0005AA6F1C|nr:hypothetical protein [Streptacidiphilus anmyonensis]